MLSFYWACYSADRRHWQCRHDWHATHSFTKEIYSKLLSQTQTAGWFTTRDSCMLEFHSISIFFFFWYLHFLILTLFAKNHICTMTFFKMNPRLKGVTNSSHSGASTYWIYCIYHVQLWVEVNLYATGGGDVWPLGEHVLGQKHDVPVL